MVKYSKVSSSAKLRLGENVVRQLMECLTPGVSFDVFVDNYFTFVHLLAHLEINKIWVNRVLNKKRLHQFTIIGDKRLQKKERCYFEQRTFCKKALQLWQWLVRTTAVRFSKLLLDIVSLRDLIGVGTKLKKTIFKNKNQTSSTVKSRTWILPIEWTRTLWSNGIRIKKRWWFLFAWMIDAVIQGPWVFHRINKNIDVIWFSASTSFFKACYQYHFSGMLERRQIIIEQFRNSKYPVRCLLKQNKTLPSDI